MISLLGLHDEYSRRLAGLLENVAKGIFDKDAWQRLIADLEGGEQLCRASAVARRFEYYRSLDLQGAQP